MSILSKSSPEPVCLNCRFLATGEENPVSDPVLILRDDIRAQRFSNMAFLRNSLELLFIKLNLLNLSEAQCYEQK